MMYLPEQFRRQRHYQLKYDLLSLQYQNLKKVLNFDIATTTNHI